MKCQNLYTETIKCVEWAHIWLYKQSMLNNTKLIDFNIARQMAMAIIGPYSPADMNNEPFIRWLLASALGSLLPD